jgi:hypothetical protein
MAAPIQEVVNTVSSNSSKWIFDTSASCHMTLDRNCFESLSSVRRNVVLADKTQVEYTGVGSVHLSCRLPSGDISVDLLHRILLVPSLRKSLYSWNSVKSIGKFALIDDGGLQVVRKLDRSVVINPFQSSNDFVLDLAPCESASLADDTDYEFCHAALRHPFKATVNRKLYEDGYLIPYCPSNFNCNPCTVSKSKLKVPTPVETKSIEVIELIHSDVRGPFPNESYGGSKYFLTVNHDFSHFSWVFFVKRQSDTSMTLRTLFNHVESQLGKTIKRIRSDTGGEYISNELKHFFLTSGVIHELTPPYLPESNGIAERFNQTIYMIACSMPIAAPDFPCLWAEAVNMAAYLKNRLPHKHLPLSTTPFEHFHGKRPTISHLKPFGSKCYVHIREEERSSASKHLPRAREAIIVGYTSSP